MTIDGASPIPIRSLIAASVFRAGDRVILRCYHSEADPRRHADGEVIRVRPDGTCDVAAAIVGLGPTELLGIHPANLKHNPNGA